MLGLRLVLREALQSPIEYFPHSSAQLGAVVADLGDSGNAPDWELYWGDLHVHSGWSYDSCEDPDAGCAARGNTPAEDLAERIEQADLDFIALTDHAEADFYLPDGEGGAEFPVWEGQAESVLNAQVGGAVVLLGYEWTGFGKPSEGRARGSHRTVILSDPTACEDYRVGGWILDGGISDQELGPAIYRQERTHAVVETPIELWAALDQAAEGCEPVDWLTFAHHPAYETPQRTDWWVAENAPVREQVVEIYSEHGSSECLDLDAEGCDWRINEEAGYAEVGAVQSALERGYFLGFVAGSDAHDAKPGSIQDGPGPVGHWQDTDNDGELDSVRYHFTAGGLTGVWLQGELTEDSLLDAIEARQTLASSGIRPELKINAQGRYGEQFLMGEEVPPSALPLTITAWSVLPDWEGRIIFERIGPGSFIEDSQEGVAYSGTWDPRGESWTYLRIRYLDSDGNEERVWISPWYTEGPSPRSCGCANAGEPDLEIYWFAVVGIFVGIRRMNGRYS